MFVFEITSEPPGMVNFRTSSVRPTRIRSPICFPIRAT
jgi:hypothetical protein